MTKSIIKAFIFILSLVGFIYAARLSYNTWFNISPCPSIASVPACYVVALGYFLICTSVFIKQINFFYGWSLIFILAFTGSFLEVLTNNVCPKLANGFPMCYISLSIALILLAANIFRMKLAKKDN